MLECIIVGIGGFIGTVCRYLIGLCQVAESTTFPIKTLIINVLGAFMIGIIVFNVRWSKNVDPKLLLLLKVGVCGGFTTFSTLALETFDLAQNGELLTAAAYAVLSVALGVAAIVAAKVIVG